MLARAYYRGGQKVEAAEMAANLLKKYPYCLDALRILVDVLPGTGRAENMQVYRQRLQLLDPYTAFTKGSAFSVDQVPDNAINLERLEYRIGAAPASSQPNWASSLGIKLGEEKPAGDQPAWLQNSQEAEPPMSSAAETPNPKPGATPGDESIPEWMRSAGWQEGNGAPEQPQTNSADSVDSGAEAPAEPLAQAEIPDWLKSMAPAGAVEEPKPTAAPATPPADSDTPDWLSGLGGMTPVPDAGAASNQPPAASLGDENVPDWLSGLSGAPAEPAPSAIPQQAPAVPAEEGEVPDWLNSLSGNSSEPAASAVPEKPSAAPAGDETVPDWLSGLSGAPSTPEPAALPADMPTPAPASQVQDTKPRPAAAPLGEDEPFVPTGEAKPLDIGDDALAWLEGLAAKQGAKSEELLTKPEDRSEQKPEGLGEQAAGTVAGPLPVMPEASMQPPEAGPVSPAASEDDTLSWLKGLSEEDTQPPAASHPAEEEPSTVPPDLFERVFENHRPVPPPDSGPLPKLEPEPAAAQEDEDVTVTGWLKGLSGSDTGAEIPPSAPQPAAAQEDLPDWLKDLNQPVPGSASTEPEIAVPEQPAAEPEAAAEPASATDLPEWLRGTLEPSSEPSQVQPPAGLPVQDEERPAWLDETTPVNEAAAPTTPEDWVPVEKTAAAPEPAVQAPPAQENVPLPVPKPATKPASKPAAAQPPAPESAGSLAHVPAEDKDAELLGLAQDALGGNRLSEAMQGYAKLIKKGRLLEETIHDLREAIYRFPVDVIVWQTLGDAYMRASRLQDALDAYTKAEELLR
jgi:hypothetical protein